MSRPELDWNDESHSEKLARKAKDSPFMIIGIIGLTTACAIGAYKFKRRGEMTKSMFLMQLRVAAQGTVVACLSAGIVYNMANEYLFNKPSDEHKK